MDALIEQNDGDLVMRVLADAIGQSDTVVVIDGEGQINELDVSEEI